MLLVAVFLVASGSAAAADCVSNYTVSQACGPLNFHGNFSGTMTSSAPVNYFYFDAPANSLSTLTVTNTATGSTSCRLVAQFTDANGNELPWLDLNDSYSYPQAEVTNGQSGQFEDATIGALRYYVKLFSWNAIPCSYSFKVRSSTPAPVDTSLGFTAFYEDGSSRNGFTLGDGLDSAQPWPNGSTAQFATNGGTIFFASGGGSARGQSVQCGVDGGDWQRCQDRDAEFNGSELTVGSHVLSARSLDASGTPDPDPPQIPFVVDNTAPTSTVTGSTGQTITGTASANMTFITKVDVTLTSATGSSQVLTCDSFFCISGGVKNTSEGLTAEQWQVSTSGVPQGAYTATAQATDWAGNVSAASPPVAVAVP